MRRHALRATAVVLLAFLHSALAAAQTPADSTGKNPGDTLIPPPPPPPPAAAPALPFDFSGVIYTNFQYGGARAARVQNRFDLDRAYLTFRAGAGEHVSIRVTTDVFQQRDDTRNAYYGGWTIRAKYAYLQYDFLHGVGDVLKANARLGILHTPIVDYEEGFWPRGLAQVAIEQAGFFSSADAGGALTFTLPHRAGELYTTVVNGNGYGSRETDRFKDYGARLSITPFANGHSILRTLSLTPWYYKGATASFYVRQRGTVLPVSSGLTKDRYGFFAGIRDPRLTLAAQVARRDDDIEAADTLVATRPTVTDRKGDVLSAYTIVRPFMFVSSVPAWPIMAVLRFDRFKPNTGSDAYQRAWIAGVGYELSKKATVFADWQSQEPQEGSTAADLRTWYLHAIVNF